MADSTAKLSYTREEDPWISKLLMQSLEYMTGRAELERRYRRVFNNSPGKAIIWREMVRGLELELDYDRRQLDRVPRDTPLVFIANHPFGVVDGVVMGHLVSQVSVDFKFLVNAALCKDELLNQFFLPVDFNDNREAMATNIRTRKLALEYINRGEPIVIFPSGGVATSPRFWQKAEDLEWKQFVVKLIRKSGATVVPIYFYGQNSRLFQVVSQFSLHLRLSLLLHEVRNKLGGTISLEIGNPITYREMENYDSKELLKFLNQRVMSLPGERDQLKSSHSAEPKMVSEITMT